MDTVIQIEHRNIEQIPALIVEKEEWKGRPHPTVIFLHGFQSGKEHNLHYAYNLVNQGVRVVLPDAHLHGERDDGADFARMSANFWKIVLTSIQELKQIYTALKEEGLLMEGKVGVGGTSMGAITTYGALASYRWIDVAVAMMGNAHYELLAQGQLDYFKKKGLQLPVDQSVIDELFKMLERVDLSKHLDRLNQRPLFIWHGEQDGIVPFSLTELLMKEITPLYEGTSHLMFIRDEEAGHAVPRPAMLKSTQWFSQHLVEADELRNEK